MVTEQALIKFKELYYQKYNISLSDEQALEYAIDLLNLMKILTKPNKLTVTTSVNNIKATTL